MLPIFKNYQEEGPVDDGYETLQDFFLSWTLRCSPETYQNENNIVSHYCRRIVYFLINGFNDEQDNYKVEWDRFVDFKVKSIETRRQKGRIDLIALVELENSDEKYILNIENKWYSLLGSNQLKTYREYVEKNYPEYSAVNLFITCDTCRPKYKQDKQDCRVNNYKFLTIGQIKEEVRLDIKTGNALFDAYWFE